MGRSVLVVELDLAMANVLDFLDLGLDPDEDATLHDVLAGEAAPREAIYEASGGIHVMPSGVSLDGFATTDPSEIGEAVRSLRSEYDVVFLDTGAGVSYETLLPIGIADGIVLVSTPRAASIRDAKKTKELTERVDGSIVGVVVVKSGTGSAPSADRIAEFVGADLLGGVPRDESVPASQDAGKPVLVYDIATRAAKAYWEIAERLGSDVPKPDSNASRPPSPVEKSSS